MTIHARGHLPGVGALVLALMLAACGSTRSSADNPLSAGGLTPSEHDKDAGLVAVGPGFDIKRYPAIVVGMFPVTDKLEDEGDRAFAAKMATFFQAELVRRLRETALFQRVETMQEAGAPAAAAEQVLKLDGAITRLGRGSQAARYFAGIYGAGRTRAQADLRLVEEPAGTVVLVTADRRVASIGMFGGDDEDHLRESFSDMARDLARFLARLARGEAPRAE